ncbi:NCS2 family permease [Clostridium thermarum]|uniref:NCS2 family permease n=1 Tax=Clostridium thermarum TaxID=1716543 RepID=UPI0013D474B7|nr:NCS2 family permease [Clostridium thermarum]
MERMFNLKEHNTNVKREVVAGLTIFMTMAYILGVQPSVLSAAGMPEGAIFTATALSSLVATLVMALYAKLPFALAPGMGPNFFFAYTVVGMMGYSFQMALTAVLIEGLIFILLTFFNVREAIINAIPSNIKKAVSVGIGLFVAFIGVKNSGIIIIDDAKNLTIGNIVSGSGLLAIIGILITGYLFAKNIKGALLIGIAVTTLIGIPMGITNLPENFGIISMPPSLSPILFKFDFSNVFTVDMLVIVFTFLFVDLFDTVGTLVGVCTKAKMLDEKGNVPRAKQALMADAIGTTFGAIVGTSTVTTFVESASGVAAGGRTGLTSLTTGLMFGVALFFSPLFLMIPAAATAPALIMVGLFMMSPINEIDLDDFTEAIPAFLTIIMMPFSYSIAEGIVFGIVSYVVLKVLTGKFKDVTLLLYGLVVAFVLKFLL